MKKKRMNSCSDDGDEVSNPNRLVVDYMVCMILSNLPVKSLMRFKCVCKSWRSLIESDPHFAYLHFTRSRIRPNLLINNVATELNTTRFFSADLFGVIDHGAAVYRGKVSRDDRMLKPVNGLICFLDELEHAVLIYNPITREETPWIKSAIVKEEDDKEEDEEEEEEEEEMIDYSSPFFGFGFDPATKNHKVVCVLSKNNYKTKLSDVFCEVLTVGQNSWRRIDEVPPYKICENAFYANGALYWLCHQGSYSNSELQHHPSFTEFIVVFDVGSEKFNRVIPIPNFILQTRRIDHGTQDLLLVDERIALLDGKRIDERGNKNIDIKMWIFDDDDHASNSISSSSNNNSSWIEETISLSTNQEREYLLNFEAIEGTDLIIIQSSGSGRWIDPDLTLYYYDRKKKTSTAPPGGGITINIKSSEFPPNYDFIYAPRNPFNPRNCNYGISTFVESLFPVQNHQQQQ